MNKDILAGNWKQVRGEILARWGELTGDEVDQARGNLEKLAGMIQERYGLAKDEARRQLDEIAKSFEKAPTRAPKKPASKPMPREEESETESELEPAEAGRS